MLKISAASLENRISFADFEANSGEFWHMLGQNGSGKSSFLLVLAGMLGSHELSYFGKSRSSMSLAEQAKKRCFLHQSQVAHFDIPLRQLLSFYSQHDCVPEFIDRYLNCNQILGKSLSSLSGGQQQRFHIARVLSQVYPCLRRGKAIVLLDEPIAQLDIKYQVAVLALLREISSLGNVVIMSCHDINHSIEFSSHVALIKDQKIVLQGKSEDCLQQKNLVSVFEHEFYQVSVGRSQKAILISSSRPNC